MEENEDRIDREFGLWLKELRLKVSLTLEDAADQAMISSARLKSLEMGFAEIGITRPEATKISKLYKVTLEELLDRAGG